jgi:hypothetical protein
MTKQSLEVHWATNNTKQWNTYLNKRKKSQIEFAFNCYFQFSPLYLGTSMEELVTNLQSV